MIVMVITKDDLWSGSACFSRDQIRGRCKKKSKKNQQVLVLCMSHSQMLGKVEYGLPAKI